MTVYIDNMRRPARVGRINARWSHLMADTSEELMNFAVLIGMEPAWLQHAGRPTEHFDLTDSKRTLALQHGAVPIQYGEGGWLTMAKRRGEPFDLEEVRRRREQPDV